MRKPDTAANRALRHSRGRGEPYLSCMPSVYTPARVLECADSCSPRLGMSGTGADLNYSRATITRRTHLSSARPILGGCIDSLARTHRRLPSSWRLASPAYAAEPSNLIADVTGTTVSFSWLGDDSQWVIEAGSAPGLSNLAVLNLPTSATGYVVTNVPVRHILRARARACARVFPVHRRMKWRSSCRRDVPRTSDGSICGRRSPDRR